MSARRIVPCLLGAALLIPASAACALAAPSSVPTAQSNPTLGSTSVDGVFAPDSYLYRRLPDSTPVAKDSRSLIASLYKQGEERWGSPGRPRLTINTDRYTAPLLVARNTDPVQDIRLWNCFGQAAGWDTELGKQLRGHRFPRNITPDQSTDANVAIYNRDDGTLIELYRTRRASDGVWEACWGGVTDARTSDGTFKAPHGAAASGLAMWGFTIRHEELVNGRIDHVIGMGIPKIKKGVVSWPANRTDGRVDGTEFAMGQMLRLPGDLDLDRLKLSPVARTVAEAAQRYGIIITDTSGALSLYGEHILGLPEHSYKDVFRGRDIGEEFAGDRARGEDPFPLDKLVALPVDYGKNGVAQSGATSPAPAPTNPPKPREKDQQPPTGGYGRTAVSGSVVALQGTAQDDVGVAYVSVGIRNESSRKWLQPDGEWGSNFRLVEVPSTAKGEASMSWTGTFTLPAGEYGITLAVHDTSGNPSIEPRPWQVVKVR